ncbi:hypothetical protein PC129_g18076 [Phytophthora cactorum]|uniref:Uncharacterized protein n=1 Tax=Phytophthora cactorum TaxID=29920 RepID=A0A8T1F7B7_9STRA|nr:hypothetical protein Pcac1_g4982 [Phytophthora cactorum]KAG2888586.1 hypothetical protein PC114_g18360 [Phytophthora cactorum]KAG2969041.1 hypothetical protein PC118_g17655 [Phytophthora cactorum]KAG3136287.1 hypothetical protein C6341_g21450 [Phytophthora cactorum]KAG3210937.1 hypothetical protein PC129_g18076 [Phytophthora cactorum]
MLPPHFAADKEVVQRVKRLCFPGLPESVEFVAEFALASLIYHLGFLLEHLPEAHPLFQSPLFANADLISGLSSIVKNSGTGCDIQPTGVTPHVTILAEIREARNELREEIIARKADMQKITESQDALCGRLVFGVSEILGERVCQSGVPTCNSMADSIKTRLEDAGVLQLLRPSDNVAACDDALDTATEAFEPPLEETSYPVYHWGGGMHLFPEDMALSSGSAEQAWVYWCCGNTAEILPPYRQLCLSHLSNRNQRKRLCELKFLMKKIELRAQALGLLTTKVSFDEAIDVFQQCKDVIDLPPETTNSRKRRRGQLVWVSAATILRKQAKVARATPANSSTNPH